MSEIVDELRRMCAVEKDQYSISGTAYWTDGQLQAVLDRRVTQVLLQERVDMRSALTASGAVEWRDGRIEVAGTLDTEAAVVFGDDGAAIEGAAVFPDGRLEFSEDQPSPLAVYLTGRAYDLNAAAADVLTDWAAAVKGGYDISVDGQKLSRSQRHSQLLEQARAFRAKAVAGSVRMRRSDLRRRSR